MINHKGTRMAEDVEDWHRLQKIEAELFNMRKPRRGSIKETIFAFSLLDWTSMQPRLIRGVFSNANDIFLLRPHELPLQASSVQHQKNTNILTISAIAETCYVKENVAKLKLAVFKLDSYVWKKASLSMVIYTCHRKYG